ncbi:DUF3653 domain-containing protein [Oceanimonas marisflavi]|uniref:DUF3653 domain-containing protein n=1 Tax=Oceanimonas marisflavi TaxID=2059724 RepID=UPI001300B865
MQKTTKNYIFRWFQCGLTVEETAKLCFKSVSTVKKWDAGRPIPPECRLLMQLATGRRTNPITPDWEGWQFSGPYLISPEGLRFTPQRLKALQYAVNTDTQGNPERARLIRERLNRVGR